MANIVRARKENPALIVLSDESKIRDCIQVLPEDSWSYRKHVDQGMLGMCGRLKTLNRVLALTVTALDEGRSGSLEGSRSTRRTRSSGRGFCWGSQTPRSVPPPTWRRWNEPA